MEFISRADSVDISRACKHFADIYTENGGGKQTYGTKFGKSSADSVGNIKRLEPFAASEFYKIARIFGSRSDYMVFRAISEPFFQNIVYYEILRHSF